MMRLDRPAVKLPTITNAEVFKSVVGATAVMTSIVTSKGSRQSTLCNESTARLGHQCQYVVSQV